MGKSCWMASLALYLNTTDLKLGSTFYLFFPALFISGIHKVPGLKFDDGLVT